MVSTCLLILTARLLLGSGLGAGAKGSVFVSRRSAAEVLRRQRRFNTGGLEEVRRDNLERECREERCSLEEAREVFEDNEKTMEFWGNYIDGDQCESSPCQNGGQCKDAMSAYVCWCQPGYNGKNCEIEIARQCNVNNGGCAHFCMVDEMRRARCECATGWQLGQDKRTCKPHVEFPCGRLGKSIIASLASRSLTVARKVNVTESSSANVTESSSVNVTESSSANVTESSSANVTESSSANVTESSSSNVTESSSSNVTDSSSANVIESSSANVTSSEDTGGPDLNNTAAPSPPFGVDPPSPLSEEAPPSPTSTPGRKQPYWASPTLPTIRAVRKSDQRIVGGDDVIPGEIPWQVSLMTRQTRQSFCGGSLLSDVWVITAAHCLIEASAQQGNFFVRAGEHNLFVAEGRESDHEVAERHVHHSYEAKRSRYNHDIALLLLRTPVPLSDHRAPLCLGPRDFTETLLRDAPVSLVSGWGRLRFQGREAAVLQKVEVPYVDRTRCKASSAEQISRFMFCAGYHSQEKDSCQGDSGGPHATRRGDTWFLTGIVSWGEECAKHGKYGIYTRISRYFPWISNITGIGIEDDEPDTEV